MNSSILTRCVVCWVFILQRIYISFALNSTCNNPLGLESGTIGRSQISATGIDADDSRLDNVRYGCCKAAAGENAGLCLNPKDKNMSVAVQFDVRVQISGVKLQGPSDYNIGHVTKFKLRYLDDDGAMHIYGSGAGYAGIQDPVYFKETILKLSMKPIVKRVYIDIMEFVTRPCLRMELVGCPEVGLCYRTCDNGKCITTDFCKCSLDPTPPVGQCKYHFPNMNYSPTIKVVDTTVENTVKFKCTIPARREGIKHRAYWYVDLGDGRTEWLHNGSDSFLTDVSEIQEQDIYDRLSELEGMLKGRHWEMKCNVTACYKLSCSKVESPPKSSKGISAKATLDRTTIEVVKGEGGEAVHVKLHGPPVLFFLSRAKLFGSNAYIEAVFKASSEQCTYRGNIMPVVKHDNPNDKTRKHCGPEVTSDNWNNTHKITIKAVIDRMFTMRNVVWPCTLNLKHVDRSGKLVANILLGVVNVTVNYRYYLRSASPCMSYTDPHMRTFDGTKFLLPFEGEYVLYRNKNYGYQVNIILTDCSRMTPEEQENVGVSCTCGAAIKVGDDVIVLGNCPRQAVNNRQKETRQLIFQVSLFLNRGQLTEGTRIYTDLHGVYHYVYLPTGTYVKVYPRSYSNTSYIDVAIYPSLSDREHSDGICGFYDGDCIGDLRDEDNVIYNGTDCGAESREGYDEFINKWKVDDLCSPLLSLLTGTPGTTTTRPADIYCHCVLGTDTHDCGPHKDTQPCLLAYYGYRDITNDVVNNRSFSPKTCQSTIRKRSLDGFLQLSKRSVPVIDSDEDVYQSVVFSESYVPLNPTWPTPSGWTEATARGYCEDFLDETSVQNCKTFMNTSFEDEVSDSTVFARAVLKLILGECLSEAMKYPSDVAELPGNITRAALYDSLCLDNCSNNGVCKNGQCECHPGFYGSVCALTKGIPPTITYLSRNGLCNIRSRNCKKSEIFGSGHIRSSDLKCRVTPYNPSIGVRDDKNQFTTSAIYIDFNMLVCPHNNKTGTFMIAVSNDNGKTYSKNELLFLAYDSFCFKCSIDQNKKRGNCTQLESTCVIKGGCFLAGALHSEDECKICDPGRDLRRWSVNSVLSKCIKTTTPPIDNSLAIIVGIVAGIVVIATAIIAVMAYKMCTWKTMIHPSKGEIDDKCTGIDGEDVQGGNVRNGHDSKNLAYTKEY